MFYCRFQWARGADHACHKKASVFFLKMGKLSALLLEIASAIWKSSFFIHSHPRHCRICYSVSLMHLMIIAIHIDTRSILDYLL
jgi:hypothetical protein